MAIFSKKNKEKVSPYEMLKPKLAEKDGKLHVVMLNTWNTWTSTELTYDEKYVEQVGQAISGMQDDGYEIVNIQHNSMSNGTGFGIVSYTTLITYK